MNARRQQILFWGLLPFLLLPAVPAARACDPAKPKKVTVSILIIYASEKDDKIDKKLECIAREARKTYPKFKGFRMGPLSWKSVVVGKCDKFELVQGQKTCVTVEHAGDKMERVRLKVGPPAMGQITYSTPCGTFLPILTPIVMKNGDAVMIAIRVQPCSGKEANTTPKRQREDTSPKRK
jgi:hypothetical protein